VKISAKCRELLVNLFDELRFSEMIRFNSIIERTTRMTFECESFGITAFQTAI